MARKLYETTTIDYSTGEVKESTWIRGTSLETETFVRLYIEDIVHLARCTGAESAVIFACTKYLDYNTNELLLTPQRRKDICEISELKMNTINCAISRLYKKNIFVRDTESSKTYLNPKLFFFGSDIAKKKIFELKLVYEIKDGKTIKTIKKS